MTRLWNTAPALLLLTMLLWSGNFVIGRAVADLVSPVLLATLRWTGALLVALPFAWPHLRRDAPALRRAGWLMLLLAGLGVAAFNTLVYTGLHHTTAINALLLQSAMPLCILVAAFALFGERPTPVQVAGITVSLLGVLAIAGRGSPEVLLALRLNPGDALVLAAVAAYSVYSALLRRRPPVHPLSFLAATFALGVLLLLAPLALELRSAGGLRHSVPAWLAISYTAVFPSFVAYLCFNRGVELIGAARAGQYLHAMPAMGSIMAVLFLDEAFRAYHVAGIALIGAGLWLATRAPAPVHAPAFEPRRDEPDGAARVPSSERPRRRHDDASDDEMGGRGSLDAADEQRRADGRPARDGGRPGG